MVKLKRDIYTKSLILTLSPIQWKKLVFIARHNKRTLTEQLRLLVDNVINVFEKHMGPIEISDSQEVSPQNPDEKLPPTQ